MSRIPLTLWLCSVGLGCARSTPPSAPPEDRVPARCGLHADGSQTFGILHVNDVYRIEGLLDGRGGIARLRRLRVELEQTCPDLLLTHGGDLLSPSLLTKSKNMTPKSGAPRKVQTMGRHMVDLLSLLDGDAGAMDDRMFMVFGNHEFDNGGDAFAPVLQELVDASGFVWLDTNLTWVPVGDTPAVASPKLQASHTVTFGDLKVGIIGMALPIKPDQPPAFLTQNNNRAQVAKDTLATLPADMDVRLAITHLDVADDVALLDSVPELDFILGGHNHNAMTRTSADGRFVFKADADAATVRVLYVTVHPDGRVEVSHDAVGSVLATPLDGLADPTAQAAVDAWEHTLDVQFCGDDDLGCLARPLTRTGNAFVAEELEMRRFETNVGDFVADLALSAYADHGAQLSFVNSGGLRLNQTLPAGVAFTRRQLEELFPYNANLYLVTLTGAELSAVAARSIEAWEGNGHWLQVSGWGFRHDPSANQGAGAVSDVFVLSPEGVPQPVDPAAEYRVVTNDYLVNTSGDRDGYVFPVRKVEGVPQGEFDLKVRVYDALAAAPETTLPLFGRICNATRPDSPCLLSQ